METLFTYPTVNRINLTDFSMQIKHQFKHKFLILNLDKSNHKKKLDINTAAYKGDKNGNKI